jgi:uncharacterized protein with ATP-grasp and redox domains
MSTTAMIRTDLSNPFAHNTIKARLPAIVREVQTLNPDYPPPIQTALNDLCTALETDQPVPMLDWPAPDYEDWLSMYQRHAGETWQATEWFFAETYLYRLLIQAVRWFETGRDPFAAKKNAELNSDSLWQMLDLALETETETVEEQLAAILQNALWGNRTDLSYAASAAHGGAWIADDLLVDERKAIIGHLLSQRGTVHLVADNTGTELAMDLTLIDVLLQHVADRVILHLKMHPTFVSDATLPDVLTLLGLLESRQHNGAAQALAQRLQTAFVAGRLRFAPDFYWNSAHVLAELPPRLVGTFQDAVLVIVKGDANYRRVVADSLWPAETPFSQVVSYFAAPLVTLRTLKSDPIVGLPQGMAARLDASDPQWRVNGRRGTIQFSRL